MSSIRSKAIAIASNSFGGVQKSSEPLRKFPEAFGNCQSVCGNPGYEEKNIRKKLAVVKDSVSSIFDKIISTHNIILSTTSSRGRTAI